MTKALKVFSWITAGDFDLPSGKRTQLRITVAAPSKAAARRLTEGTGAGVEAARVSETGNPHAKAAALALPNVLLASELYGQNKDFVRFDGGYGPSDPAVEAALGALKK